LDDRSGIETARFQPLCKSVSVRQGCQNDSRLPSLESPANKATQRIKKCFIVCIELNDMSVMGMLTQLRVGEGRERTLLTFPWRSINNCKDILQTDLLEM
jgi:hypothetical protein